MSKYKNVQTIIDGIRFDSKKEAGRYQELKLLEKVGEILHLTVHRPWILEVRGHKICEYESDFDYWTNRPEPPRNPGTPPWPVNNKHVVEDVKSAATRKLPVYRLKAKLMKAIHGIEIQEV